MALRRIAALPGSSAENCLRSSSRSSFIRADDRHWRLRLGGRRSRGRERALLVSRFGMALAWRNVLDAGKAQAMAPARRHQGGSR
jgi:hypothetical protein